MKQHLSAARILVVLVVLSSVTMAQTIDENTLTSVAEISGFTKTATYDEVMQLCRNLSKSPRIHLTTMGKTSQGRDIPLMVIANDPPTAPSAATRKRLTIYVQGNIHAGEVCGKEAVLILARELFEGQHPDLLNNAILLFAPIYNADGNQPLSKANRKEQHGPDGGVGQRANAQGLDLNRDHLKLEAPEARAFARVMTQWDPAVVMDLHTTNGSYHRFHLTYDGPRAAAAPKKLVDYMRDNFLPEVSHRMEQSTGYKSFYYGNFNDEHNRWNSYPAWPRYGTQYVAVRGRLSILSEAYAYASYRDRVLATRQFVLDCLRLTVERKDEIQTMLKQSRDNWNQADLSGKTPADVRLLEIPVRTEAASVGRKFTALGYDDSTRPEGARRGILPTKPQDYEVEFIGLENPIQTVKRPFAYLIPSGQSKIIENLAQQGIELEVVREGVKIEVESYRIDKVNKAERAFQNHFLVDVQVTGETAEKMVAAGTIVAKTAQDLGRLLIQMLEPASQDGLVKWNFFDESLQEGATFPVVRLMQNSILRTAPYADKRPADARKKRVGFEDIYGKNRINLSGSPASGQRWLPDGDHYAERVSNQWRRVNAETGQSEPLFDHDLLRGALASLPGLDSKRARQLISRLAVMQPKQGTALWNQSGDFYTARLDGTAAARVTDTPDRDELGELSPNGNLVAFVRNYDLFVAPTSGGASRQLTFGGNSVVRHGKADWVYYEEIYNRNWKGYRWSPDSQHIAFMEYNDTPVKPFVVLDHLPHRLDVENERYPKAGDPIPSVRVGVVNVVGGPVTWMNLKGYAADNLIVTRYDWLPDSSELYLLVQDRAQRWMDVLIADATTGQARRLFREKTKAWVPDPGKLHFLKDGTFLMRSDRDGWRHYYRFNTDGKLLNPVTSGEWEVRDLHVIDETNDWIYFSGTRFSHLASNVYRVKKDGSELTRLTKGSSNHRANMSPTGTYFVDSYSDLRNPTQVGLRRGDGTFVRQLDNNPVPQLDEYELGAAELIDVPMRDGTKLPGIFIKPPDFDPNKKYPVWLRTYAGPHAFTVSNSWRRGRARNHMLANLGIIVFEFDPRSASGRGPQSTWTAYRQLGLQELMDLEDAADALANQPFIDGSRIGIGGYSYGGFMASYVLTHSKKFAAAFAGAPVTDWRNYDAFYTERYMDTPQENPDGYDLSSVVKAAGNLHGRLLVCHGAMDDNVHVQNTMQLSQALQKAGVDFDMMIYPKARHGIHSKHFYRLRHDFIRRNLLK